MDADMIGAMLTGIKSFVEQAFQKGHQDLEEVGYSNYKLLIFPAPHFYIVFVLDGVINPAFKRKMYDKSIDLIQEIHIIPEQGVSEEVRDATQDKLKSHFYDFNLKMDELALKKKDAV